MLNLNLFKILADINGKPLTTAQQIHHAIGVHDPKVPKQVYRSATPERQMRKGEDGMRKPGAYGRNLMAYFDRQRGKPKTAF